MGDLRHQFAILGAFQKKRIRKSRIDIVMSVRKLIIEPKLL